MTYHVVSKPSVPGTPYNKRRGVSPVPLNIVEFLNHEQLVSLRQMEYFGWRLAFVRRMGHEEPSAIVGNGRTYAKLEADGSINTDIDLNVRI